MENQGFLVRHCRFIAWLFLFCIFTHLLVIANPGFFSHDEWQKYDHVSTRGLADFVSAYGELKPGPDFGYPVRPLGFIQQGFASAFMMDAPWFSHLVEVIVHFSNVLVLMLLLRQAGASSRLVRVAAVIFVISPLSITSTGWSAASFDRIYPFFAMWAIFFTLRIRQTPTRWGNYVGLLIAGTCASLSKETAQMLPILIAIGFLVLEWRERSLREIFTSPTIYLVCAAIGIPFFVYLMVRLPALLVSFGGNIDSVYEPESSNILYHIVAYWSYPFVHRALEMSGMVHLPVRLLIIGGLLHLSVVALVGWRFGWLRSLAYIALYFVFLVPVISITNNGAHYLYAATPVLTTALAALLVSAWETRTRWLLAFCLLLLIFSTVRFVHVQNSLYQQGMCQARIMHSLDTLLPVDRSGFDKPWQVFVNTDKQKYGYVAVRFLHERDFPGAPLERIAFTLGDEPDRHRRFDQVVHMSSDCTMRLQ